MIRDALILTSNICSNTDYMARLDTEKWDQALILTSYSNSMYEMPARYIVNKHDLICIEKQIMLTAHVQYVIPLGIAPKTVLCLQGTAC